jgi:hypothetical protein
VWSGPAAGSARVLDDEHTIEIDGRRWRATDPAIPEGFRTELVRELMAARRDVGAAKRAGDERAERSARDRVQDAKVALGERGAPWWETPSPDAELARIEATTRALARHRAPDGTICPSDVARAIGGDDWRKLMGSVREAVTMLRERGVVSVEQRGTTVPKGRDWKGPIRVRLRPDGAAGSTASRPTRSKRG